MQRNGDPTNGRMMDVENLTIEFGKPKFELSSAAEKFRV